MGVSSSKPSVQRQHFYNMPLHEARKALSAHLSKDLRVKLGIRAFPLRKGDTVTVMRGSFKGKNGKIKELNYSKCEVMMEGMTRKKLSGKEVAVPMQASNLMITELELTDKKRVESLERKGKGKHTQAEAKNETHKKGKGDQ